MTELALLPRGETCLLVLDYQNGIVEQIDGATALLHQVNVAIDAVRSNGGQVGWVRAALTDADFDRIPSSSVMAPLASAERRAVLHVDSPATHLDDRLHPADGDIAVRRTRIGAFFASELDDQLRARGITTLILSGIVTSQVVLSTALEALDRDYRVIVLRDACADRDPDVHEYLMRRVLSMHTTVLSVEELGHCWDGLLADRA